jgi:cold shock CspA family protein
LHQEVCSVSQRVKEINSATGVLIPFAARYIFRVKDAARAEKEIFEVLAEYRLRSDREFFKLPFSKSVSIIQQYVTTANMRHRRNGTVLWYDKQKHYGFISMEGSDEDLFLHSSQIQKNNLPQIIQGANVEFDLGKRPQGLCALNVSLAVQTPNS